MKKISLSIIGALAMVACQNGESDTATITLNNNIDSVSYAVGVNTANGLQQQFSEGNMDAFMQGFKDVVDSAELLVSTEDAQAVLQGYSQKKQMEQMAERQKQMEEMFASVKEEGIKFLEENKTKAGVQVTASGLQYIVLKEGKGKQPTAMSNVKVHYHGTTPDGVVFDSSVDRGEPIEFPLNGVIAGWTEGVQLMKEGAKYKFFIPQELAYGANAPQGGQGPIKPFMPLVFEVELIKVND
ncbi:MAG: FKBP-type peptidyl-prolyl cis-trans isomerase [Flavobacteriales bacterium]|nr:FKBP-type peptidyl-prolyl cis-trans isomerase [Flavobacteriales bacterium]